MSNPISKFFKGTPGEMKLGTLSPRRYFQAIKRNLPKTPGGSNFLHSPSSGDDAMMRDACARMMTYNEDKLAKAFQDTQTAFNQYTTSHNLFDAAFNGKPLKEQLSTTAQDDLDKALKTVFEKSTDYLEKAKKNFENRVKKVDDLRKNHPGAHSEHILRELYTARAAAALTIKKQQMSEIDRLEDAFKSNKAFKDSLLQGTGPYKTDAEKTTALAGIKESMLKQLKASQEKQGKNFEEETEKAIQAQHEDDIAQRARILFIHKVSEFSDYYTEQFAKQAAKNRGKMNNPSNITLKQARPTVSFEGLKIEDVNNFTFVTGTDFTLEDGGKKIKAELSSTVGPKTQAELDLMALEIRASGNGSITFNISHNDPRDATTLARQAYDAGLKAGFESHNIIIRVNGEERDLKKLKSGEYPKQRENQPNPPMPEWKPVDTADYSFTRSAKAKLDQLKSEGKAEAAKDVPDAPKPGSSTTVSGG